MWKYIYITCNKSIIYNFECNPIFFLKRLSFHLFRYFALSSYVTQRHSPITGLTRYKTNKPIVTQKDEKVIIPDSQKPKKFALS